MNWDIIKITKITAFVGFTLVLIIIVVIIKAYCDGCEECNWQLYETNVREMKCREELKPLKEGTLMYEDDEVRVLRFNK